MALPLILEGTWEEISAQADQFKDHKLQLIVLPVKVTNEVDEARQNELRNAMLEILDEPDAMARESGIPLTDPYEIEFGNIIEEKYRRLGLIK